MKAIIFDIGSVLVSFNYPDFLKHLGYSEACLLYTSQPIAKTPRHSAAFFRIQKNLRYMG